jgi:hypothetical protein
MNKYSGIRRLRDKEKLIYKITSLLLNDTKKVSEYPREIEHKCIKVQEHKNTRTEEHHFVDNT